MGTRGLTMVLFENEIKVAQYGQWDHYPSGQGQVVTDFISANQHEDMCEMLKLVRFGSADELEKIDEVSENSEWYHLNRDLGSGILEYIMERYVDDGKEIVLCDKSDFAADSIFCEYAYLVNLDNKTLEVYRGFNKNPLAEEERFFNYTDKASVYGYYPIRLALEMTFDEIVKNKGDWSQEQINQVCGYDQDGEDNV